MSSLLSVDSQQTSKWMLEAVLWLVRGHTIVYSASFSLAERLAVRAPSSRHQSESILWSLKLKSIFRKWHMLIRKEIDAKIQDHQFLESKSKTNYLARYLVISGFCFQWRHFPQIPGCDTGRGLFLDNGSGLQFLDYLSSISIMSVEFILDKWSHNNYDSRVRFVIQT